MSGVRKERHGEHDVFVLEDGAAGSSARVLPDFGFNCYSFRCRIAGQEFELLRSDDHFAEQPARPAGNGIPLLFPFPNRIRAGRFEFEGKSYELPRNERGVNAIHGLVHDRPWRVKPVEQPGRAEVVAQFRLSQDAPEIAELWPADFLFEVSYLLEENRLTSRVRVTNPDSKPLPWGFGTHPYFRLPLKPIGNEARCRVVAPVEETWELNDLLPTGKRLPVAGDVGLDGKRPFSELKFDDVFTRLQFADGWCTCRLTDSDAKVEVSYRFDRLFRELVVYVPPARRAICLEPYTCVTDAINLQPRGIDAGLNVLRPGETAEGVIELEGAAIG